METFKEIMNYLEGYQHVADFQRVCGVEIVDVDNFIDSGSKADVKNRPGDNGQCDSGANASSDVKNGTHNGSIHRNINGHRNGIKNPKGNETKLAYKINNKLLFYMFEFGAGLGSEMFYLIFCPFMIWNVDTRLTRQLLLIWYPLMYFGQFLKDWIQLPRPGLPAVRLEGNRFEMEYGMPSTHTIVGTCMPFGLLVLTSRYYEVYF